MKIDTKLHDLIGCPAPPQLTTSHLLLPPRTARIRQNSLEPNRARLAPCFEKNNKEPPL